MSKVSTGAEVSDLRLAVFNKASEEDQEAQKRARQISIVDEVEFEFVQWLSSPSAPPARPTAYITNGVDAISQPQADKCTLITTVIVLTA